MSLLPTMPSYVVWLLLEGNHFEEYHKLLTVFISAMKSHLLLLRVFWRFISIDLALSVNFCCEFSFSV